MAKVVVANTAGTRDDTYPHPDGFVYSYPPAGGGGGAIDTLYTLGTPGAGQIGGAPTYDGAFIPSDGGTYSGFELACWDDRCFAGPGSTDNHMYLTGKQQAANSGPFIFEVAVPALVTGTNINSLNVATISQQPRLHNGIAANLDSPRILGINNEAGNVILGAVNWYDTASDPDNYAVFRNPANLAGAQAGTFRLTGGRHNAAWVIPVPAEFHEALGYTHLSGMGGGISIVSTTVCGASFYGVNAADIVAATTTGQSVPALVLCDHSENNGTGMMGDMYTSLGWNFLSAIACAFFIPGTRTIMCIGQSWAGNSHILYKGANELGEISNGHHAFEIDDYRNNFWLFDFNDLLEVKNGLRQPHQVIPYEHGELPLFPFGNRNYGSSLIGGGFMHPVTKKVFFTYQRGAAARFAASPTVGRFSLAGVA